MAASSLSVVNLIILLTAVILYNASSPSLATGTSTPVLTISGENSFIDALPEVTNTNTSDESATNAGMSTTHGTIFFSNDSLQNTTDWSLEWNVTANSSNSSINIGFFGNEDFVLTYRAVYKYATYAAGVPGIIGNCLTLIVLIKLNDRTNTTIFMTVLSCTDLFLCVWRIMQVAFGTLNFFDISARWFCVFLFFPANLAIVFSNIIVCCWTIERFIAVMYPLKMNVWCTSRNTKIILIVAFLVCFGLDSVYLKEVISYTIPSDFEEYIVACDYSAFYYEVWNYIDSVFYICIPMIIVCTLNVAICCKMYQTHKKHQNLTSNSEATERRAQDQRQMTMVLLMISASFVLLHAPLFVYVVYEAYLGFYKIAVDAGDTTLVFAGLGVYKVVELQNAINFILYMITARKFRNIFYKLFKGFFCKVKPSVSAHIQTVPPATMSNMTVSNVTVSVTGEFSGTEDMEKQNKPELNVVN